MAREEATGEPPRPVLVVGVAGSGTSTVGRLLAERLDRDPDGRAIVRPADPSGLRGIDLWLGEGTSCVQVYTGDTLAEPGRRGLSPWRYS
ncbi:hypothetical protein ACIBG6_01990 [Streptomyces sp. NPDC050842]|uniref:hypothetical protein n=1 Tax=Streptomyces sp. NPDC050842 TaxID=3365636 RepID=UPI00379E0BD8